MSRCDCLSFELLSPHFLRIISAYTPDLGRLAVWFLYVSKNERYGCKLRWSATRSRYKLGFLVSENVRGVICRRGCLQVLFLGILSPHIYSITLRLRRGNGSGLVERRHTSRSRMSISRSRVFIVLDWHLLPWNSFTCYIVLIHRLYVISWRASIPPGVFQQSIGNRPCWLIPRIQHWTCDDRKSSISCIWEIVKGLEWSIVPHSYTESLSYYDLYTHTRLGVS